MSELSNVTEQIKNRIMLTDVLSPFVQLQRRGGRIVALCPFHKEKSPSFSIDNLKGTYHCFGCGQHGDHFSFLTEHQGMTFGEALTHLAERAGVQLPEKKPRLSQVVHNYEYSDSDVQQDKNSQKDAWFQIMEQAANWYQEKLLTPSAQNVRDYLNARGLTDEMVCKFRIGFAPSNESLSDNLRKSGATQEDLATLGLVTENGADRFKGRLMFPIGDAKGRIIAFGGRALSKDQMPKYLNSPETPLFHKSSVLYAQHYAFKSTTRENAPLVVEGYMDVITLHQFGFETAVAPLGTAFSDDHIKRLWQRHPSPVFCFDGDDAGKKAAFRVAQRIFPLLKPHFSVQFCFLPNGEDPDTYLKTYGKHDFNKLLQQTTSLANTTWFGYLEKFKITTKATPEEKTIFKKALAQHINEISDSDLKQFFQRDFNDKFYKYFNTFTKQSKDATVKNKKNDHIPPILTSEIVQRLKKVKKSHLPAKILLATLKNNPTLVTRVYETMMNIEGLPDDLALFRDYLCEQTFDSAETLTEEAIKRGFSDTLALLDALDLKSIAPFAMIGIESDTAFQGWMDVWSQHYLKLRVQNETNLMKARLKSSLNEKSWEQWQHIKTALNHETKN